MSGNKSVLAMPDALFSALAGPPVVLDDKHFNGNYNTELLPEQETKFLEWANANKRLQDLADYDMRGAWLANTGQSGNGHYPDTFKKPNHPTFSDQSRYHNTDSPLGGKFVGGSWGRSADGKDTYTPSREMVSQPGYVTFMQQRYMPQVEPNGVFNMDKGK